MGEGEGEKGKGERGEGAGEGRRMEGKGGGGRGREGRERESPWNLPPPPWRKGAGIPTACGSSKAPPLPFQEATVALDSPSTRSGRGRP